MTTNDNKIMPKLCSIHKCLICDYNTCKKSSYENHLNSKKHKNNVLTTESIAFLEKKSFTKYQCKLCNKEYNDRAGLWRHKKKCNIDPFLENNNELSYVTDKDLIVLLIKQNTELIKETTDFKNIMMDVIKNGTHNIINTNSHNKSFNLQFF